jgi:hypothetical protein
MKKFTKIILKKAVKYAGRTAKDAAVRLATDAVREATGLNSGKRRAHFSEDIVMRSMRKTDREEVLEMMRTFYSSEAVLSNGSDEIFNRDIKECISDSPYAEGFVFEIEIPEPEAESAPEPASASAHAHEPESAPDTASESATSEVAAPESVSESAPNPESSNSKDDQAQISQAEADKASDTNSKESEKHTKKLLGYAMIAHSFSTEYGKRCIWIEDLYLKEEARGLGLASAFLEYIRKEYPDALHRLESEHDNEHAMEVYKHKGFTELPYVEMIRETK